VRSSRSRSRSGVPVRAPEAPAAAEDNKVEHLPTRKRAEK